MGETAGGTEKALQYIGFYPENTTRYSHNEPLEIKDTHGIAVGRIEYDTDAFVFTSLTGYTEGTFWRAGELDFASTDFLTEDNNDHIRSSFSQEFRLQSNNDSPMQWIVGGIYAKDEEDEREDINFGAQNGFGLPDGFGIEIASEVNTFDVHAKSRSCGDHLHQKISPLSALYISLGRSAIIMWPQRSRI